MNTEYAWLGEQAFGEQADPPVLVKYQSQQDAVRFLQSVLDDSRGIGLIHGPKLAGKTTIVRNFVAGQPGDTAVAIIDGSGVKSQALLSGILAQFGYKIDLLSTDELLKLLNVFVAQQARANQAPIIVIDNLERMYPSALRTLCALATLSLQGRFAVRIILVASRRMRKLLKSEGMIDIAKRMVGTFEIKPLSANEAMAYLHARLTARGLRHPDRVFPVDVCDKLHKLSEGWPGLLNEQAFSTMVRATKFPVSVADTYSKDEADRMRAAGTAGPDQEESTNHLLPRLIVTSNGKTICEVDVTEKKLLIGRSDLADIVVRSEYVSKYHALMMMHDDGLVLIDLKSANGTLVNSRMAKCTILRDNDIISIGDHRIKVLNTPEAVRSGEGQAGEADTTQMKTLEERRSDRLQQFFESAGIDRTQA